MTKGEAKTVVMLISSLLKPPTPSLPFPSSSTFTLNSFLDSSFIGCPFPWRPVACVPSMPLVAGSQRSAHLLYTFCLQAVKVYSKALCLFPDFKEANVNVAQSYKELAMLPEGLKHFDKVRRHCAHSRARAHARTRTRARTHTRS